jgi:L-lactate dehydrogenase complex protein LldG
MSANARDAILAEVRKSLAGRRGSDDPAARLASHARNLVPDRSDGGHAANIALFIKMIEGVSGTVERVAGTGDVPKAVAGYLARHNLPPKLALAPDSRLAQLPWAAQPLLDVRQGAAHESDQVAVTGTFAAIAETGTLMMASFADRPNTLNFLPDNHVVVVSVNDVVGTYEDGWDRLRAAGGLPRTTTFITGPSRTSDIELVPTLGAHGPRRLHVILVGDAG